MQYHEGVVGQFFSEGKEHEREEEKLKKKKRIKKSVLKFSLRGTKTEDAI